MRYYVGRLQRVCAAVQVRYDLVIRSLGELGRLQRVCAGFEVRYDLVIQECAREVKCVLRVICSVSALPWECAAIL